MSTLTTIQATDLITNSRANINDNFAALNADKLETSVLDTDTTLAANSDSKVPTQKAVKAYVDAGGGDSIPGAKRCHVYQTGATTIGATFTVMDFGAERFDTDTMHDNVTNPSRITFTTAGVYLVGGNVINTGANTYVGIAIRVDGTTYIASTTAPRGGGTDDAGASASVLYNFTAGQYVEFLASRGQDGGGSTSGDAQTNAWAVKLG